MRNFILTSGALLATASTAMAQEAVAVAEPLVDASTVQPLATAVAAVLGVLITVAIGFTAFRYARKAMK